MSKGLPKPGKEKYNYHGYYIRLYYKFTKSLLYRIPNRLVFACQVSPDCYRCSPCQSRHIGSVKGRIDVHDRGEVLPLLNTQSGILLVPFQVSFK